MIIVDDCTPKPAMQSPALIAANHRLLRLAIDPLNLFPKSADSSY